MISQVLGCSALVYWSSGLLGGGTRQVVKWLIGSRSAYDPQVQVVLSGSSLGANSITGGIFPLAKKHHSALICKLSGTVLS
jgi:hypothetical protein